MSNYQNLSRFSSLADLPEIPANAESINSIAKSMGISHECLCMRLRRHDAPAPIGAIRWRSGFKYFFDRQAVVDFCNQAIRKRRSAE